MSKVVDITAKTKLKDDDGNLILDEDGKQQYAEATVKFDIGEDLSEKIELFNENIVNEAAEGQLTLDAQAVVRRCLNQGLDQDAITAKFAEWAPGQKFTLVNPMDAITNALGQLASAEDAQELLNLIASRVQQ